MVVAGIGLLVLGGATAFFTRGVTKDRRKVIVAACLFPFACFAWAGIVFVFQAIVNEGVLQRDLGLGDTWHCPLPNGYRIMMIDVADQGWVYNPKTQHSKSAVGEQEDAVAGVRTVQVAGRYILGGADTSAFAHLGQDSNHVDSYFLLDTQTGKRTQFQSYATLRGAAQRLGIEAKLEPINSVYSRYRFSWFDVFVGFLFCVPPLVGGFLLVRWVLRLRRTRPLIPNKRV